jgi:NAD(P)-dependent dehydrogenase (short-subunit alcohol dehydrogenase family)
MSATRPFAIVTGASTGIGFELAKRCAKEGYDLLVAADESEIKRAAASLRDGSTEVEALQADLATTEGVDKLYAAVKVVRSMPFWRMPGAVSAMRSWTRILEGHGGSSTPISPVQFI